MKIVQWNIHHGGPGGSEIGRQGIALSKLNADIICLNEVEQFTGYGNMNQAKTLADLTGLRYFNTITTYGKLGVNGPGNAILAKESFHSTGVKFYSDRSALIASFDTFSVIATHLDNDSAINRAIQASQLLDRITLIGNPFIICGDFNCQSSAVELAPVSYRYVDAWTQAVKSKVSSSFNGTGNTKKTRIDYIFAKGFTVVSCDVPDTRVSVSDLFPSDHNPVVAEFK